MSRQKIIPQKQQKESGGIENVTVIGSTGSGKTVVQDLIMIRSYKMMETDENFDAHIVEKGTGATESISNMIAGRFPPKTGTEKVFEAVLELRERKSVGPINYMTKITRLNFMDVAGEVVQKLIEHLNKGQSKTVDEKDFAEAPMINDYLLPCDGLIVVASVPRSIFKDNNTLWEREPTDISRSSDVNLSRFLEQFYRYKQKYSSVKIKKLGFIFTKTDLLHHPLAAKQGYDLSTHNGRISFLVSHYKMTYGSLRWYSPGLKNVRFFPSYVDLEYDPVTKKALEWPEAEKLDSPYKIKMNEDGEPSYSDDVYEDLLKWFLE